MELKTKWEEIVRCVKDEYERFKQDTLKKSPEKIYEESYRIEMYRDFVEYISDGFEHITEYATPEQQADIVNALYRERDKLIYRIYLFCLSSNMFYNFSCYDDITDCCISYAYHIKCGGLI